MYDACLVLQDDIPEDEIVRIRTLPATKLAVLDVICSQSQLNRVWEWLFTSWLPSSGKVPSAHPVYEYFPQIGDREPDSDRGVRLCLPLIR